MKIKIPVYNKKRALKKKLKLCQYPGCTVEFYGIKIAKYCDTHRSISSKHSMRMAHKNRVLAMQKARDINTKIITSNIEPMEAVFRCALEGCNKEFAVILYKRTKIYPKYCEEHRNEHKRWIFQKLNKKK